MCINISFHTGGGALRHPLITLLTKTSITTIILVYINIVMDML